MHTHLQKKRAPKFKQICVIAILLMGFLQASASDYYWVGGSGSWNSPQTHWATSSGGAVFYPSVPSQFDRVIFDANSFTAAGQEVTMNAEGFCLEFRSKDVIPGVKFTTTKTINAYSGFSIDSNMVFNMSNANLNVLSGDFTLGKNVSFTMTGTLQMTNGNANIQRGAVFYLNGPFNITKGSFYLDSKTTYSQYSDMNLGNGSFNLGDSVVWTKNNSIYVSGGNFNIGAANNFVVNGGNIYCNNGNMTIGSRTTFAPNCCQTYIPNGSLTFDSSVVVNSSADITVGVGNLIIPKGMNWTNNGQLIINNGSLFIRANANFRQNYNTIINGSLDVDPAANILGGTNYYMRGTGTGLYIKTGKKDLRRMQFDGNNGTYTFMDDVTLSSDGIFMYGSNNVIKFNGNKINVYRFYSWTGSPITVDLTGTDSIHVKSEFRFYYGANYIGNPVIAYDGTDNFSFIAYNGYNYDKVSMRAQNTGTSNISFEGVSTINKVDIVADGTQSLYFDQTRIKNYSAVFTRNITGTQLTQVANGARIDSFNVISNYNIKTNFVTNSNNRLGRLNIPKMYQWTFQNGSTQTIDTLVSPLTGACGTEFILNSSNAGSAGTLSMASGTFAGDWLKIRDCNATGGATFFANNTSNLGNVTGWTINAIPSRSFYWIGGTGNWNDGSHWSLTSGGTPVGCALPSQIDDVFFDANSFNGANQYVNVNVVPDVRNMTWSNVYQGSQFTGGSDFNLWGSLELNKRMVWNHSGTFNFASATTGNTIRTDSVKLKQIWFGKGIQSTTADWKLLDYLNTDNSYIYLQRGKLITNGQNIKAFSFHNWFSEQSSIDWTGTDSVTVQNLFYSYPNNPWTSSPKNVNFESNQHFYLYGGGHTFTDIRMNALSTGSYIEIQQNITARDININAYGNQWMTLYHSMTVRDFTFRYLNTNSSQQGLDFQTNNPSKFRNLKIIGNGLQRPVVYWRYHNTVDSAIFNNVSQVWMESGYTKTINKGLYVYASCDNRTPFYSPNGVSYLSMPAGGYVNIDYGRLQNLQASGGGSFNTTNSIDDGGNTGWNMSNAPTTNFYWVGGSGNWSDKNHWSLTSGGTPGVCPIPSQVDNVFFDVNSFTAPNQTVTVDVQARCLNMTWNNVNFPNLNGNGELYVYGSMTLDARLKWQHTNWTYFKSNNTGNTVTTKGVPLYYVNFNGTGEWTLGDNLTTTGHIYVNSGSFVSGGKSIKAGQSFYCWTGLPTKVNFTGTDTVSVTNEFRIYPDNFTLTMGGAVVKFSGTNNFYFTGGNKTYSDVVFNADNTGSSVIQLDYSNNIRNLKINAAGYQTVSMNSGSTYNDVTMLFRSTTYNNPQVNISGNNTFNDMTITSIGVAGPFINLYNNNTYNNLIIAGVGTRIYLGANQTQTVNDALALGNGSYPVFLQSTSAGTQGTLYKPSGTVCMDYIWLKDVKAAGGAQFNAGTTSVNLGNNSNWLFTSCAGYYWVGGSGNWSDYSHHWAYNSGGTIMHNTPPTQFDDVYFDANSFTTTDQVVTIDDPQPKAHNFSFASALYTPTLKGLASATEMNVYGSLKLITNMNQNFTGEWNFRAPNDSNEINTAGKVLQRANFIGGNNGQGGWILRNNLTVADAINLNNGTFRTNGKEVITKYFNTTTSNTRKLDLGASIINILDGAWNPSGLTNLTFVKGTSEIVLKGTSNSNFFGNGLGYYNVSFRPTNTMTSLLTGANTYNKLRFEGGVNASLDPVVQTATLFEFAGSCNKQIGIQSTTDGMQSTFNQTSGTVTGSFINLKDNIAAGGATFKANQSQDLGNTTGWQYTAAPVISISTTSGLVNCTVNNDGWAKVTVLQGKSPFTFTWSTNETTDSISHLIPGVYTVTVKDSNGCTASDAVSVVNRPSSLAAVDWTATAFDICQGTQIKFTPNELSTALYFNGTNAFVQVPNSAAINTNNLTVEAWIKADASQKDYATILDKGSSDGTGWSLQFNGSTGNIRFWTPNGIVTASSSVKDNAWHHLAASYNGTNLSLYVDGVMESSTAVSAMIGNTAPLLMGKSSNSGMEYKGLIDEVRIWSAARSTTNIQANRNNDLTGNESGLAAYYNMEYNTGTETLKDVTANANNGTLNNMVTASDWVVPGAVNSTVSYAWNFGDFTSSAAKAPTKTYTSAGTYTVSLGTFDKNGCPNYVTKTVRVSQVTYSVVKTNVACKGTNNGSIILTPSGGIAPYSYSIDNGVTYSSNGNFTGLAGGNYRVIVKDSIGCASPVQTYTVTEPASVLAFSAVTAASCPDLANGTITVTASGGTGPYQYSKNGGISFQSANVLDLLAQGSYMVKIRDANNCLTADQSIAVGVIDLSNAGGTVSGAATVGADVNSTTLTVSGYTGSISKWQSSADANFTSPVDIAVTTASYTAQNLAATTYFRAVITTTGCGDINSASAKITVYPRPQGSLTANGAFCVSGSGQLTWTATEGVGPYTIVYNDGVANRTATNITSGVAFAPLTANVTSTTTYTIVSVTDTRVTRTSGFAKGSATIAINPLPVKTISASGATTFCDGGSVNLKSDANGASYVWSTGATTQTIAVNTSGSYSVTVTDVNGCTSTSTATIVTVNPLPTATTAQTNVVCTGANTGKIEVIGTGGTSPYQYSINGGAGYQSSGQFNNLPVSNYSVFVKDARGCSSSAGTVTIIQVDTTKPTITAPEPVTVVCASDVPAPNIASPTASDNCSVVISFVGDVISDQTAPHKYIITRTYRATDPSGNTATATQIITVNDNIPPVISGCPSNITVLAAGPAGQVATYTAPTIATDNCSGTVTLVRTQGLASGSVFPIGDNTVVYTATDASGNTSTCSFVVTVTGLKPEINCPPTFTANAANGLCTANVNFAVTETTAIPASTITYSIGGNTVTPGNYAFPVGTTTVTATATNAVGSSSCTYTVVVSDTQKPSIINLPADQTINALTLNCATLATWVKPTASDNCGIASIVSDNVFYDAVGYTLLPVGVNKITYTVTDIHGNVTTASFNITVVDNQAPIITGCPSNITVNAANGRCDQVVNWNPPTASDNCPGVSLSANHVPGETFPIGTTTVTYTATDHAGLQAICTFTVTVLDTQKPILTGVPSNVTVECNAVPAAATVTAADNCATTVAVVYNETRTNGNCPSNYTLTRTWSATDAAGNTAIGTQVITVQDTQAPVLSTAPANVTVECNAVPIAAILTATDNCDTPVITYNEVRTNGGCPSNYILTRTWTATDACGNTSFKTQVITVQDTQAPVLSAAPANVTVECDAVPAAAILTAADNCDTPVITYNEVRTNGNSPGNYTLTRKWIATDACGNTSSKTQTITVRDTKAPVLSAAPANVTVECNAVPVAAILTATDNCDTPAVVYSESRTNGNCPSNYTLTRTWTAIDASGNTSSRTQIITVQDTQAPVLSVAPANITVECDAVPAAAILTATDNCDTPAVVYSEVRTNGNCPSNYTLTRTWTATDACGNTSGKTQIITVQDTQAPVLSVAPADITVECDAVPAAAILTATDNCENPTVVYNESRTNGNSPHNYILTRTWTATDACGNSSSRTQMITVQDTHAPVISAAPADITVECNAVPAAAILTATDNCDTPMVVYNEVRTNGNCPSNYTLTRTWTSTDVSGNTSNKTQVITVQDTQAPVLSSAPADVTVECNAVPAAAILTATDNCDTPVVVYNESRTNGNCPSNYTLTRTWTATDACGNTSSKTQVITVQDTQAPVLSSAPADVTVECNAVPAAAILTATDNCDTPFVVYNESRTNGNCPSNYTLTRTWTATDACGNSSSKTQVITVRDTQAPVLSSAPADVTVECNSVPAAAILTATDNCDTPVVVYNESRTNGNCPSNYTLTRTWTATDACGNSSSKTQVITVQDTQAPVLSSAPADVTVECNAVPAAAILTATDNCDTPVVKYAEVRTNGNCPSNYTLTRTWTATDACGNSSSKTQVITVQDTQAPVLSSAPADVTVECSAVPAAAILAATDNCDTPVVVYNESRTNGNCPSNYTLTRTWTATDACGNTSSKTQIITVQDTQTPILSAAPVDITVECDAVPAAAILTATDNCGAPTVIYNETRTNGNSPNNYTLTRTWTATDACGNTSSKTQVITVRDTKKPVLSTAPADVTVECNAVPAAAVLTATDNCDAAPVVTYAEVRTNGNCPSNYTLTRTWTATDASGNSCSRTQVITVQDTQKPVLSAAPANITVACDAVPVAAILTATDNCDTPAVTYAEVRTNGSSLFNYTLTRTWTATDACGNSCSKTQVITVRDTQAPVPTIAALPTLTGDCAVTAAAPTATDNCAGLITGTTVNPTSYTAQGVYTITWTYDDGQGNTSTQLQRVVVKDQSGPIANEATLPIVTGQCSATVSTKPTATDACSGVTAPGTTTDPLNYTAQGTYTIHWTYTDNFGNKTYQDQTVIVKDNLAPVPNVAALPTIEGQCSVNITMVSSTRCTDNCFCCRSVCHCRTASCNCNQWGEWLGNLLSYFFGNTGDDNHGCDHDDDVDDVNNLKMQAPTATDNCKGTITGTTTDPLSYNTQGTYTIHWTFNDGNGNISVQEQTVKVADVEAPVPNVHTLPTVYGTCSATVTTKPTAKDNCKGTITGTTTDPLTYTGDGTYTIHWTFSDGNGNITTQNQTVVISDNIKPKLTEPNDITISCGQSTLPAVTGNATATDNCGTPTITYTDAVNGNKITRTWKATDAAGNYVTDVQVITIADNVKPVITAPANVTVNCGTSTAPIATGVATATDNCSTATVTYSDNTGNNGFSITRTWKATDAAGNYATATQVITIVDNVKPVITAPNSVTVNCGSSTNPGATGTATASDACSNVSVTYSDASSNSVITRTWKATDASGNFATATQTITIVDNTKPTIADISDITISCSQSTAPSSCGGTPNASDNCSTPTVTYSDVTVGNKITRTWKATDAAGNFATSVQMITIVDNTKPVLTEPNDITINCGASTLPAVTGMATATDACSTPTITYTDTQTGNVITRTWKATDASGNYATDVQYITIGSSFTAAITSVPANSTYTGGVNTNLYLGYGAQSTTLTMCNLPSSGAPYTYAWGGSATNRLSSLSTASPVFTPATFGYYTFSVTVTNKYGCTSTAMISICVNDIRVPGTNGAKVYVCHTPNGKNKTPQTLQLAINQVSAHIGSGNCGSDGNDRLGSCDQQPCNTSVVNTIVFSGDNAKVTKEGSGEVATTDEDLKVTVMPNPSNTYFTLKLESRYDQPVNMRVMDARGRVIDAKSKIGANSTIQIGHNYSSGIYYAEMTQGNKRKVVQMIKGRG